MWLLRKNLPKINAAYFFLNFDLAKAGVSPLALSPGCALDSYNFLSFNCLLKNLENLW